MAFDVFISYSSLDRPWAIKLEADLRNRGVKCFLDQLRLTRGLKWEPQLVTSLLDSRHFVVLWSDHARNSDWVSEELVRFKIRIDPQGDGRSLLGHLLYAINLQGQNATLAPYQCYLDPEIQQAYKQAADAATFAFPVTAPPAWETMVAEIAAGARANNPAIQVPVAVLALTTAVFDAAPPVKPEFSFAQAADVDAFLARLGVEKTTDLRARYGTDPFFWRPYGTSETVGAMLDNLLKDPATGINLKLGALGQPPVRWNRIDIVTPALNLLPLQPLLSGPCLLIVDPVSLFSLRIWQRYVKLQPCFSNPQAAIVFLTPIGSSQSLLFLRECLAEQGKPNLEWFHDPIPFNPGYANCGINIADKWDIRRLVLASLGRQPATHPASGAEPILSA